ncbi:hypothetical protein MVEN_01075000 [Mycena venus]|uniref:DUF6697 domain-containing protein n=1 Tax=Mycena venus TaxID=2733690 RepID=A0A8H7CZQ2_9AGAR|nr:hypothetical protein MVEN_01075000 [Mycena venus]
MAAVPGLRMVPTNAIAGLDELLKIKKGSGNACTESLGKFASQAADICAIRLERTRPLTSASPQDPTSVVEMALEVEVERARAIEALSARDAAIHRLSEAYVSLRQKMAIIERLQKAQAQPSSNPVNEQVVALEMTIKTLRQELASLSTSNAPVKPADPPPSYNENGIDHLNSGRNPQLIRPASDLRVPLRIPRETPPPTRSSPLSAGPDNNNNARVVLDGNGLDYQVVYIAPKSSEPEDIIKARNAMLAVIPLPADPPDDTLKPIVIPPPFTLHEFLANATGSLRNALSNYRVLQELTTSWCPEREEHGYLLTPLFKCSTNPRVATAHRWNMVDVMARMSKPTECFYNKDGNWYYAGVYKAFRLEDLTTKEWDALSAETTQALVKDTMAGRKNTSPQNVYETTQLYAAGALKVACIGLQCVGFNKAVYHAVLEQAAKCASATAMANNAKFKGTPPPGTGLGAVGGAWNAAGDNGNGVDGAANGIAAMSIGGGGSENVPVLGGKGKK